MDYTGYRKVILTDDELACIYQEGKCDKVGLFENEYLAVVNKDDEVIDKFKMKNGKIEKIPYCAVGTKSLEIMKPRNLEQYFAFDLLKDDSVPVKLLVGKHGSGKTSAIVHAAIELMEKGKFSNIAWVRNNIEVRDTTPVGALPGELQSKLLPYLGPFMDAATEELTTQMLENGTLKVLHLGFMRGRDIRNSLIICSEGENLTTHQIQMLVGRISEGSMLMMDADLRQRDKDIFEKSRGIEKMIDKMKGHPLFGYVYLPKSERSPASALADLLDEE
jgi:putative phosphate starvation-inducible protein phoH/ATPase|nr:MAG TPA: NYN ribonuclease and ATPase [Caudoviricetes sp.]